MGLLDKYKDWKNKKNEKYFSQHDSSYNQTRSEAKEFTNLILDDKKLANFSYTFKKEWYKPAMPILKKIAFLSLLVFTCLLAALLILYGCSRFICHDYQSKFKPEEWEKLNYTAWKTSFVLFLIPAAVFLIYAIILLSITFAKNKKFNSSPNYLYTCNSKLWADIILILAILVLFFNFKPFNFIPLYFINLFKYQTEGYQKFIVIFASFCSISCLISYLSLTISKIFIHSIKPKFDINLLKGIK